MKNEGLGTLTPKRLLCQEGPESRFVGKEGSITIVTLNWQVVASPATIQHVGNAGKVLFPQHKITTNNITVRQRSPTAVSQADEERKSHKYSQH